MALCEMSTTVGWIAVEFGIHSRASRRINCNSLTDPMNFLREPPSGQNSICPVRQNTRKTNDIPIVICALLAC